MNTSKKIMGLPILTTLSFFTATGASLYGLLLYQWFGVNLDWDRFLIERQAEWWRLWTGHWVHWNLDHALWNIGAFIFMMGLYEMGFFSQGSVSRRRLHLLTLFLVGAPILGLAELWLSPGIEFYRGLSGLASALFISLCVELFTLGRLRGNKTTQSIAALAVILFLGKILFEFFSQATVFTEGNFHVSTVAHLTGAFFGLVASVFSDIRKSLHDQFNLIVSHHHHRLR